MAATDTSQSAAWSAQQEQCIEALQRAAARLGDSPSRPQYKALDIDGPSASTIQRAFDDWNTAKEAAGLETDGRQTTRADCIIALVRASKRLGEPPSRSQYRDLEMEGPSAKTIARTFDGFTAAKEHLQFDLSARERKSADGYTEAECIDAVVTVAEDLGKLPTADEYRESGQHPCIETIIDHIGSWRDAKTRAKPRADI